MLFKKLYYYYHHYKMWNYIVGQLKVRPQASLLSFKLAYSIHNYASDKYLTYNNCYLCSYIKLIRPIGPLSCSRCPLYKKYKESCFEEKSLFFIVNRCAGPNITNEERIAAAEKIRDCVLFWKNRR